MTIRQLIYRNFKKNLATYYLYVFALLFSVALYFAFVTLQFDPSMDETAGTIKGAAAIKVASVLLIAIVGVFLLYANTLFIKRRSKEIGLYQLIGMTRRQIFNMLSVENMLLYFTSLFIGICIGFAISRFILMILIKITGIEAIANLHFSTDALIQTVIVFTIIFGFISLMNWIFIRHQSILNLFRVRSKTEAKIGKVSFFQILIGILGIALIAFGYYVSSRLFSGDATIERYLFFAMLLVLASVILGTSLFYKGSITFIFFLIRKKKGGYLSIREVLSLSSIMFRMKSNALLLTIITTVSALAIGLLSLSYISYYSAEKTIYEAIPNDYAIVSHEDGMAFSALLDDHDIAHTTTEVDFTISHADLHDVLGEHAEDFGFKVNDTPMIVVSDKNIDTIDLQDNDTVFINYSSSIMNILTFNDTGTVQLSGKSDAHDLKYQGLEEVYILPFRITSGGFPVAVVSDSVFHELQADEDPDLEPFFQDFVGIDLKDKADVDEAEELFHQDISQYAGNESRTASFQYQKENMGITMFVVGFLGLTFLVTSGCILYFKQMGESEEERPNYTILRKLGFTTKDLLTGIKRKQLFNFGIPLVIGLCHSYFAVKSGWFFFGNEMLTPTVIVMLIYTALYSIFGFLSVLYYKKVIKSAL
ncbi:ABC transporter permease [Ornithinibacillus gellani]|uniref:FtsX-like permease family protein n=1 Tax=Ornithinibacillus gellani TaxID=2293253 RepID=UPI000F485C00|nr:FtsX-like permease family protein [Ornithinibacillus gellani]TQS74199.1 ABC transporter permease [Ornithinibacillus gellani]